MRQVQSLAGGAPAVCQPLLLFTKGGDQSVCTVDTVHCECAVIDSVTLVSVLCEHCVQPKHPLLFRRGDIGLPTSGWQQQGTLDNHPPCGICIPDIAGADPWHWTLDIGFQCRLGKRCCKLARLQWTSHPGIPFSQCIEGIMATLEPPDNSNNR